MPDVTKQRYLRLQFCKGCGGEVVWMKSAKGGRIPVVYSTALPGDREFLPEHHIAHASICPAVKRKKESEST